jgi:hypothetical protein
MPDVDIEIVDAPQDVGDHGYPMADELRVEGMRVRKGDLIFLPGNENLDSTWEVVYGFDWGGIYTDSITGFQMPRFREWSTFVDSLENGTCQVVFLREETSFYSDEETVRTLSHYRNHHEDGLEFILVEQARHPLETTSELQSIEIYETVRELIDEIYTPDAITTADEAEAVYELLIDSGVRETILPDPDEISNQAGLNTFTD